MGKAEIADSQNLEIVSSYVETFLIILGRNRNLKPLSDLIPHQELKLDHFYSHKVSILCLVMQLPGFFLG